MRLILQRYLGSRFVWPFALGTTFLVVFLLTFQMFKVTKLVINKGVPLGQVLELMSHLAVTFFPLAIPLSLLFATLYALSKMSEDSEIIVMRSLGLSKGKLFLPFLIVGLAVGVTTYSLNQSVIPYSKRAFKRTVSILTNQGFLADVQKGTFYTQIPGITLFAEDVEDEGKTLLNVFIHLFSEKDKERKIIFAEKGTLFKEGNEKNLVNASWRMKLDRGNIIKVFGEKEDVEKILFKTYDFPIFEASLSNIFVNRDSMRKSSELWKIMNEPKEEVLRRMSFKDWMKVHLEFWNRLNTPFLCILFILLGFGLGVQSNRGKRRNTGLVCLCILVIYYSLFFTGISLARKGNIPPALAVSLPTIIGYGFGFYFYRRLEWSS